MTAPLVLFIPAPQIHPPSAAKFTWLNTNMRPHWSAKGKVTKAWRNAARQVAEASTTRRYTNHVHVVAEFHKPTANRYDAANLYPIAKAALDGIVDAGVLVDDDNDHVTGPDPRPGKASKTAPGVTITIIERD